MAYVPPHLRKAVTTPSLEADGRPPTAHIPTKTTYTIDEIISICGTSVGPRGTLNATGSKPDTLAYMLLFGDRQANYNSQGHVFCKSNLHLLCQHRGETLPSDTDATNPQKTVPDVSTAEFPVFLAHGFGQYGKWKCMGWHHIDHVTYLPPRSAELVRMLNEKFAGVARSSEEWHSSLSRQWAAVMLEKVKGRENENPMEGLERKPAKSVKQLLEEMRSGTHTNTSENGVL